MTRVAASSLIILAFLASSLIAQGTMHTSKVSVPDDLVVRQAMSRAEDALTQKDLDRALKTWQEVLDRMSTKVLRVKEGRRLINETDHVVPGDIFMGVRSQVMSRILELGEEAHARYEKLMEPRAKALFSRRDADDREAVLRELGSRFLLTPTGRRGQLSLIDMYLEQARFREAASCARSTRHELIRLNTGLDMVLWLLAREAHALWGLGDSKALEALAAETGHHGSLEVAGDEVPLEKFVEDLQKRVGRSQRTVERAPEAKAFSRRTWSTPLAAPRDSGNLMYFAGRPRRPLVHYFPVVPTLHDGVVYWSDGSNVRAQSLFTGMDAWAPVRTTNSAEDARLNRNLFYRCAVDGDLLFTYLLSNPAMRGQRAWNTYQPIETIPNHRLMAINISTGEVVWDHDNPIGVAEQNAGFLARLNVNQQPLVLGDTVYFAGSILKGVFYHWIVAADRNTGIPRWRTFVGAGQQELNMFGNAIKECTPGPISQKDGVLYYCTNIGVFSAIDASNGTILWQTAYDQELMPGTDNQVTTERHPGWMPSAPAFFDDKVVFAPTDSLSLYIADRETGEARDFPHAARTVSSRNTYFLGVHGDNLVVAGDTVTAFNVRSGKLSWSTLRPTTSRLRNGMAAIQGMPTIHAGRIWYTGSLNDGRSVLRVANAKTGSAEAEIVSGQGLDQFGHVVVDNDAILVASNHAITAHFDPKALEEDLRREARNKPSDPSVLMDLAEIERRQGNWGQSLRTFERALKLAKAGGPTMTPQLRRATNALYSGWMRLAEEPERRIPEGPASFEKRYLKALEYASSDRQRVDVLMSCLDMAKKTSDRGVFKRTAEAIIKRHPDTWVSLSGHLLSIIPEYPAGMRIPAGLLASLLSGVMAESRSDWTEALKHYHYAQSTWPEVTLYTQTTWSAMGDRINSLIAKGGRSVYSNLDREARRLFKEAKANDDLDAIRSIMRRYPQSKIVEDAYMELSNGLLRRGDKKAAMAEMLGAFARFEKASAQTIASYIRTLDELECVDSVAQVSSTLKALYPGAQIEIDGRKLSAKEFIDTILAKDAYRNVLSPTPAPEISDRLQVSWTAPLGKKDEAALLIPTGRVPKAAHEIALVYDGQDLHAVNARNGKTLWAKACVREPLAAWHDNMLVASIEGTVTTIDPQTGDERWRLKPESGFLRDLACGHGKVYLLMVTLQARRSMELRSYDIVSGAEVQKIGLRATSDGLLAVSPGYVAVLSDRNGLAVALDALTGKQMPNPIRYGREMTPVFNSENQLVILQGGERATSSVRVVGTDPATGATAWAASLGVGSAKTLLSNDKHLVVQVRPKIGQPGAQQFIHVVDVQSGKVISKHNLPVTEFGYTAAARDDRLYVCSINTRKTESRLPRQVRCYGMSDSRHLWSTAPFAGEQLEIGLQPVGNGLLIHKLLTSYRATASGGRDELYQVDGKTGKFVDFLDLGAEVANDRRLQMHLTPTTLVVATDTGVKGFKL